MFTKNTVLVLGAGASCHFGYPTGDDLISRILNSIQTVKIPGPGLFPERTSMPLISEIYTFKPLYDQLLFHDPLSIDSFLTQFSSNKPMLDAGKMIIVYEILQAENPALFLRFKPNTGNRNENWYRFLINALISGATPQKLVEEELRLKVITFNYDLSLEYALYSRFENHLFLGPQAFPFLKKISENIVHIYGQVGQFEWNGGERKNEDYGKYKDEKAFIKADRHWKDKIFVIGQDRDNKVADNAAKAMQWLSDAEVVFFLGFGFNEDNINLLKLKESCEMANQIYCTNYGDSDIITQKAQELFKRVHAYSRPTKDGRILMFNPRSPVVSTKTVYEALLRDFNLLV
ncbi:MAG: hypothetical protein ACYDBV_11795 [Nitrospiria bacterium]